MAFFVVRYCWHYKLTVALAATGVFLVMVVLGFRRNLWIVAAGLHYVAILRIVS